LLAEEGKTNMKRALFLIAVVALVLFGFVLSVSALSAQGKAIVILGGGIGEASQDTSAGTPWNASSGGIFMSGYMYWPGNSFVMYWAAMFGRVLDSEDDGDAIDLGQYRALLFSFPTNMDVLWGFGYRLQLGKSWTAVLAAGFYTGATVLLRKNVSSPEYDKGGYGPGIGASLSYSLASNLGIGASVNLGYSLDIKGDEYLMGSKRGLSVFGGVGLAIGM
jgi:hypothetical protein